jgi:hypothetical protein
MKEKKSIFLRIAMRVVVLPNNIIMWCDNVMENRFLANCLRLFIPREFPYNGDQTNKNNFAPDMKDLHTEDSPKRDS